MPDLVLPPARGLPHGLVIPDAELLERFSRSSGPGGQGVNTADSRVELRWDIAASAALNPSQRSRLLERLSSRLVEGAVVIVASEQRAQLQNRAAARDPEGATFLGWGFSWPSNRRILYNRASAAPDGQPWSERKKYVWWDAQEQKWTGFDVPDFQLNKPPDYMPPPGARGMDALSGRDPFIMKPDGKAWLFVPRGLKDGPLPTHYEAIETPVRNAMYRQQSNPTALYFRHRADNRLTPPGDERYPIVITTYRLAEHHVSGPMTRWLPWLNALQPSLFVELSPELAAERGIAHGDWLTVSTPRGEIEARAMVTRRMRPLSVGGRIVHQIGLPFHWGFQGKVRGSITNDLAHMVLEPNVSIEEAKAFMCDIKKGRLP